MRDLILSNTASSEFSTVPLLSDKDPQSNWAVRAFGGSQLSSSLRYEGGEIRNIGEYLSIPSFSETNIESFDQRVWGFGLSIDYYPTMNFDDLQRPWLPARVTELLKKAKSQELRKEEITFLMKNIAERAIEHYDIPDEKFVALSFSGRIVEVADNKIDLLRRIQGMKCKEPIFVWYVGSEAFTGWTR